MEDEELPDSRSFGALLRRYRLDAGLSQAALAERARMSTNAVSALERGYRRTPQRGTLALLSGALALDERQYEAFEAAATRQATTLKPVAPALPIALTTFVGRETEIAEIAALVRAHRMVTLTGPGGIGKTQAALHASASLTDLAPDAVLFVDLAPLSNPALVATAIASAFGVRETARQSMLDTLRSYLNDKDLLLVLDNCEHVIDEAARVAESLLLSCPHIRILATSRAPLRSGGEYVYRLPSLNVEASIALFSDRAAAADPQFALGPQNAAAVSELCCRLEGLPLVIELAAARVATFSMRTMIGMLTDRLRLLSGDRTTLRRQQTIRALIDWSYDPLTDDERRMFEQLSVFAGGCTLHAVESMWREDESANAVAFALLSSLLDKSLISVDFDGNEPRYSLLESFRQYAAEKLAARGETRLAARRHALACLAEAERLDLAYESQPDAVWRALAREGLDNWRAALQWTLTDGGDVLLGQQLVAGLRVIWQYFAPLEGQRWLELALSPAGPQPSAAVRAKLEYIAAIIAWALRDQKEHLDRSEHAVELYRDLGDSLGLARAQNLVGHALVSLGRFSEAMPTLEEALSLARAIPNHRLVAYTLRNLAWAMSHNDGDRAVARAHITEALEIYEQLGAKLNVAFTLYDLGECEFSAGTPELALRHAAESVAMLRAFNDMPLVATALDSVTVYLVWLSRFDEARNSALEVLELSREHRLQVLTAYALQHLVAIALLRGHGLYEPAARILGFVDAQLAAMGARRLRNQEQLEYDRVRTLLLRELGAARLADLMRAGASMSEPEALSAGLTV